MNHVLTIVNQLKMVILVVILVYQRVSVGRPGYYLPSIFCCFFRYPSTISRFLASARAPLDVTNNEAWWIRPNPKLKTYEKC